MEDANDQLGQTIAGALKWSGEFAQTLVGLRQEDAQERVSECGVFRCGYCAGKS